MHRKIWIAAAALFTALIGLLIWKLDIPHWKKLDLSLIYARPESTVVYGASGEAIGSLGASGDGEWTDIADVPQWTRDAFVAAEDQRFYSHRGVSLRRIAAAAIANLKSGSYAQGASTITQQLIKLTHLSGAKTLSRKAQEAFLALALERRLSKDDILECYLNTVYFGHGAYGIAEASDVYFSKAVSELTLSESALLAGIIKAPSNYAPHIDAEKALSRRDYVLSEMAECGFISAAQASAAKSEALALNLSQGESTRYGWFLDAALDEAAALTSMSADALRSSGYSIHTAFDPAVQDAADALFADSANFPASAADGTPVQAALVAMRADTGEICALVGGREYAVRRGLNRATQIQRSPGSTIKPVSTYAAAIDAYGLSPTSMVEDAPREFDGGYAPSNAGGNTYGTVTLREALSRSLNLATVDLADLIGVSSVREYAARFGLTLSDSDANLALALGSMTDGVSPAQLCAAYAALANGGTRVQAHIVKRISDASGHTVYASTAPVARAVQLSTAYMLTDMLKTAATSGSARALSSADIPVAGKTGTVSDSDGSTRDVWTAAYTPELAMTVWMGFDAPDASHQLASSEGGSGYPARLLAKLLLSCRETLSGADFAKPSTVASALVDALALERDQVLLATSRTPSDYTVAELFHPDSLPEAYSSEWDAPEAVTDLHLLTAAGETPALEFTARSANAEYLLIRRDGDSAEVIATLTGEPGQSLRFADTQASLTDAHAYTVLPRHRLLYASGELLTGPESAPVVYSPGGLFSLFLGDAFTSDPPSIEIEPLDSLFG